MIIRQWRGIARKEKAAAYTAHFREAVLPELRKIAGFLGATVMRKQQPTGVEVTVLTRWESMTAVRAFAGKDTDVAIVAEPAKACFSSYDTTVSHHEVIVQEEA